MIETTTQCPNCGASITFRVDTSPKPLSEGVKLRFTMARTDDTFRAGIEAAAKSVPTNWVDPLLTGANAVIVKSPCPEIEALLHGVRERIRVLKKNNEG